MLNLFSGLLFAGGIGEECKASITSIPCSIKGWDFGVTALYLKPSYGSDFYLTNHTNTLSHTTLNNFEPAWSWGFMAEVSYHYHNGNDINVNWYHHSRVEDSYVYNGAAPNIQSIASELKHLWDAVNVELGQKVLVGERSETRFHGGLQYAHINSNVHLHQVGTIATDAILMKYNGAGPRVGVDYIYVLNQYLSMYAKGAASILYLPFRT